MGCGGGDEGAGEVFAAGKGGAGHVGELLDGGVVQALDEARLRFALYPTPHEAYGLCAVGLSQFKAAGLAVVFDHTVPTFYRVSRISGD